MIEQYGSTGDPHLQLYMVGSGNLDLQMVVVEIVGIVEWIVLVAGMEKEMFLPSASSIIGARTDNGMEFGVGPNLSLSGIGMVYGLGYKMKSGNLNLPVNISVIPGSNMEGTIHHYD